MLIDGREETPESASARAFELHQRGALAEAASIYRAILRHDKAQPDCLHLLGLIARETGAPRDAVALIRAALAQRPEAAHYHSNLANALRDLGQTAEALEHYEQAARLRPASAEIRSNLGTALLDLGRTDEAVACYRAACAKSPEIAVFHYNLANALSRPDRDAANESETRYRECLRLNKDFADARYNFGKFLLHRNRLGEAEEQYRETLRLCPELAGAWNDLGIVLQRRDNLAEAASCHARAVALAPDSAEFHYNLGCVALARNDPDAAAASYQRTLDLDPGHAAARFARCMAHLPILYHDEAEIARRRKDYTTAITTLDAEASDTESGRALAPGVGASPPFFLAYQGQDDRALQTLHGDLVCRVMAAAEPKAILADPPRPDERIRVGLVSGFFHDHTIWSLFLRGWIEQLDRARFSLFGYHTGARADANTERAAARCEYFRRHPLSPTAWRDAIIADAPHVLIYPEIGIDPVASRLAAQRLAPVQCMAWGHPITSGLPTIDFFLSGGAMEGVGADTHYSERLIRLPGLGIFYTPPAHASPPLSRDDLGLRAGATVFWSGQALYKYLPQHDDIFPKIALELGDCQFVFIAFARCDDVTDLFRRRLARAFAEHGLDAERHCVILPPLTSEAFLAAIGLCDIVLDTIGWSGGRSTLEALAHDPAIVTCPGPLMRGRHTAAMLELMGAGETIAPTQTAYINIAVRLARDPEFRGAVRARVAAGKHRLFADTAAIAGLEAFLARCLSPG